MQQPQLAVAFPVSVQLRDGRLCIGAGQRYMRIPDHHRRWMAGLGLARHLMEILIAVAARAAFETMDGYVLAANRSMRGLAKRLGFSDKTSPDDPGVRLIPRGLQGASAAAT